MPPLKAPTQHYGQGLPWESCIIAINLRPQPPHLPHHHEADVSFFRDFNSSGGQDRRAEVARPQVWRWCAHYCRLSRPLGQRSGWASSTPTTPNWHVRNGEIDFIHYLAPAACILHVITRLPCVWPEKPLQHSQTLFTVKSFIAKVFRVGKKKKKKEHSVCVCNPRIQSVADMNSAGWRAHPFFHSSSSEHSVSLASQPSAKDRQELTDPVTRRRCSALKPPSSPSPPPPCIMINWVAKVVNANSGGRYWACLPAW